MKYINILILAALGSLALATQGCELNAHDISVRASLGDCIPQNDFDALKSSQLEYRAVLIKIQEPRVYEYYHCPIAVVCEDGIVRRR